jgi:hypothetical protein
MTTSTNEFRKGLFIDRKPGGRMTRRSALATTAAGLAGLGLGGGAVAATRNSDQLRADPAGTFADTVVLITGGTSGIGQVAASDFAMRGAKVVFCGRRDELGVANQDRIRAAGGDATFQRADVREETQVRDLVDACVARHGRIDVAFNNAGIETPRASPLHEQSVEDWDDVTRTNARGVFLSMKYELPHMLAAGRGVIINTRSQCRPRRRHRRECGLPRPVAVRSGPAGSARPLTCRGRCRATPSPTPRPRRGPR